MELESDSLRRDLDAAEEARHLAVANPDSLRSGKVRSAHENHPQEHTNILERAICVNDGFQMGPGSRLMD